MPAGWLDHAGGRPARRDRARARRGGGRRLLRADRRATAIPTATSFAPEELLHPAARIRETLAAAPLVFDRLGLSEGEPVRLPAEAIAGHGGRTAEAAQEIARALSRRRGGASSRRARPGAPRRSAASRASTRSRSPRNGSPGRSSSLSAEISAGFRLREPRARALRRERDLRRGEAVRHTARRACRRPSSRTCGT